MSLRFPSSLCLAAICACVLALGGAATGRAQQNGAAPAPPPAAPAPFSPELTPDEARRALTVLQDPEQRARLVDTLRTIARAAGPAPPGAAPAAEAKSPADAATAAAPGKEEKTPAVTLQPDSLAAQLVSSLASWPRRAVDETVAALRTMPDLYLMRDWLLRFANDPSQRDLAFEVGWRLALVFGVAVLLERLVALALRRPAARLAAAAPDPAEADGAAGDGAWHRLRRLPVAAARLVLKLIPIALFWTAATVLTGFVPVPLTRMAIALAVNAYATIRIVLAIGRMLLAHHASGLRLLHLDDDRALYLMRWLRRLTLVAVLGGAAAGLALLFGLHPAVYATLIRLLGLVVAVLLGIVVLQSRGFVAARLRAAPAGETVPVWRDRLAAIWHYLALLAIAAGWIGWAAGFGSGAGGIGVLL